MKAFIAECIGTFALVFCGTGAIVINDVSDGMVTHPGVAITFGLIVMVMIYAFRSTSGAHINPAVTLAFSLTDRFDRKQVIGYIVAQIIGAFIASFLLRLLFPEHLTLGMTVPSGSWYQTFILEIILTFLLMIVILFVSQNRSIDHFTGLAVGGTVLLEALFAGPITGASMNPARSISPAVVSGQIDALWIYLLAPVIGACLASFTWRGFSSDPMTDAKNI